MAEEKSKDNFVNITDCLEAVSVFKAAKNFLFFLIFVSMLILAACFILADVGLVKDKNITGKEQALQQSSEQISTPSPIAADINNPAQMVANAVEKITSDINSAADAAEANTPIVEAEAQKVIPDVEKNKISIKIDFIYIHWLVKVCGYLLIISASLYSLVLIFSLKVSLLGNLGGINHIARAFILSLFLIVFLFPWQRFFGIIDPVAVGAIYLPKEILHIVNNRPDYDLLQLILHYLRFAGWWLISFILLFAAQRRSIKWAKATLRRLGIE